MGLVCSSSGGTPLPWRRLAVLLPAFMADALAVTVVFPFLPFMVQSLMRFGAEEQYKIGFYTGLLGGSYELGQIISSPFWGALSDRCGRRPVILTCLFLGSCFMMAFGFSTCFWVALMLRFGQGLVNGALLVGRTYMADITDASNEAFAFALIGMVWGSGDVVGPVLGGLLSDPAEQYPTWYASQPGNWQKLLLTFPYIMPCAAVSIFGLIDFTFVFGTLPETLWFNAHALSSSQASDADQGSASCRTGWTIFRKHAALRLACAVSFVFGSSIAAYDQMVPVWARDQLNASPEDLGTVQSLSGIVSIGASLFVITRLVAAFGTCTAMCISLVVMGVGYVSPAVDIALGMQGNPAASRVFLYAAYSFKALGCESCFTGVTLLLKRCSPPAFFGTAQGIGNGFLSLGLASGPLWGPPLFALSTRQGGAVAGAAPFAALAVLVAAAMALTRSLAVLLGAAGTDFAGARMQQALLTESKASA